MRTTTPPLENERDLIRQEWRERNDNHISNPELPLTIVDPDISADWWLDKIDSILEKKREEIESMKKEQDDISTYPPNILTGEDYQNTGYNQALSDVQDIMKL